MLCDAPCSSGSSSSSRERKKKTAIGFDGSASYTHGVVVEVRSGYFLLDGVSSYEHDKHREQHNVNEREGRKMEVEE